MLPQSSYELYSMATQSAVNQRLQAMIGSGLEGATQSVRPQRVMRKSAQGGADWRQGANLDKEDASMLDLDLTPEEVSSPGLIR